MQVDSFEGWTQKGHTCENEVDLRFLKTKMFASTTLTGKQAEKNSARECNE